MLLKLAYIEAATTRHNALLLCRMDLEDNRNLCTMITIILKRALKRFGYKYTGLIKTSGIWFDFSYLYTDVLTDMLSSYSCSVEYSVLFYITYKLNVC